MENNLELVKQFIMTYVTQFITNNKSSCIAILTIATVIITVVIIRKRRRLISLIKEFITDLNDFIKNIRSLSSLLILLIMIYYFFKSIGIGDDMMPELVGAGISLILIDFILDKHSEKNKRNLVFILNSRIERIHNKTRKFILQMIREPNFNGEITRNLIFNRLDVIDIVNEKVQITYTSIDGVINTKDVPIIDIPYYLTIEIRTLINQVNNYSVYYDYQKLASLVKLEEIINEKWFLTRATTVQGLDNNSSKAILNKLTDSITEFYMILNKINN